MTPFLAVTPLGLTIPNGIQAYCYGQPRGAWGCNLDNVEIEQARAILTQLCVASIVGGVLGIWGAATRNPAGRSVWLGLAALSIVVALWNIVFLFQTRFNFLLGVPSLFWAAAYANACLRLYGRNSAAASQPL